MLPNFSIFVCVALVIALVTEAIPCVFEKYNFKRKKDILKLYKREFWERWLSVHYNNSDIACSACMQTTSG